MPTHSHFSSVGAVLAVVGFASVASGAPPAVPIRAVLEADSEIVRLLPRESIIAACNEALSNTAGLSDEMQAEIRLRRGWAFAAIKQHAAAKRDFDWVIERFPGHSEARCARAECRQHLGEPTEALQEWEELVQADPEFAKPYESLGLYYLGTNQADRVIAITTAGLDQAPTNARLLYVRGAAAFQNQDYESCLRDLHEVLNPEQLDSSLSYAKVYSLLGLAQMELGKLQAAEQSLRMASMIDQKNGTYFAHLCRLYLRMERYGLAMAMAEILNARSGPQPQSIVMMCAVAYLQGGEFQKAAQCARRWQRQAPGDPRPLAVGGVAALGLEEYLTAQQQLKQALAVNPDDVAALGGLAIALALADDAATRDLSLALECAERLCDLTKSNPGRGLAVLGAVRAARGEVSGAIEALRESLDHSGDLSQQQKAGCARLLDHLTRSAEKPDVKKLAADVRSLVL